MMRPRNGWQWSVLIGVLIVAALGASVVFVFARKAYIDHRHFAMMVTGGRLAEFVEAQGRFPSGWAELDALGRPGMGDESTMVGVKWDLDLPAEIAAWEARGLTMRDADDADVDVPRLVWFLEPAFAEDDDGFWNRSLWSRVLDRWSAFQARAD